MAAVHHKMNMGGHNDSEHVSVLQQHPKVDVCERYKSKAHCITWSVMISAQHCLQPPTECWREEVPY